MSHLPELITDLAFILITAGITTLIFKRLGQPLVLGYIVAGFLAGPHMPYMPTVSDTGSVQTWADIGVIFLMFTLGLEFSFKKILRMGKRPVVAALLIIFFMICIGSAVGHFFGWRSMDSLFLGGMLAMSSTTIIYKAFDDLGLRGQKFAGEVLSVLIIEDILGILLMVILSAVAVSRDFEGGELVMSLLKLAFFLILWFIVGMYVVPTFLRKSARWMNGETLLIVSVGLCFALVVGAAAAGYSAAFGAFMMGSILAETLEAEKIARVVDPVKNLFGAIFFVSVGMLVAPDILVNYAVPIAVITCAILLGQSLLGSAAFMLSGQSLRVAMQCGFSMAQIGEFAFIIASLGLTLGVTSDFLYPVVVAVSVITTFLTPYMIRAATPAHQALMRLKVKGQPAPKTSATTSSVNKQKQKVQEQKAALQQSPWHDLLYALGTQISIYLTLTIAAIFLMLGALLPFCYRAFGNAIGGSICGIITLIVVSPFLRAVVMRKNHSNQWKVIAARGRRAQLALHLTLATRGLIAVAVACYVIDYVSPLATTLSAPWCWAIHLAIAVAAVVLMIISRPVKYASIRMERTFRNNWRMRDTHTADKRPRYAGRLLRHNMHMAQLQLPPESTWGGQTLRQLDLGRRTAVIVAAIIRGGRRINIPGGDTMLYPGDSLEVLGDDDSLQALTERINRDIVLTTAATEQLLVLRRLIITDDSPLCGHKLRDSRLKERHHCMAVGFEQDDGTIDTAASSQTISAGDTLWLLGEEKDLQNLPAKR